jgi:hypothetical protein
MSLTRPRLVLAALLVTGIAATTLIAASSRDSAEAAAPASAPAYQYGVFRRLATQADSGPVNPSLVGSSRAIHALVLGATEWVSQSDGETCVTGDVPNTRTPNEVAPGFACAPTENLASTGGVLTLMAEVPTDHGTEYSVIGLAPDGVRQIDAVLPDGSTRSVPVGENGFQFESDTRIDALAVTSADKNFNVALGDNR